MRLVVIMAGLLWGLTATAHAHVGTRLFPIIELTDEDLARIDLHDGSVDDWRDVVGEPSLTASEFYIGAGDGRCFGPDRYAGPSAQTARKVPRLAGGTAPPSADPLSGGQKGTKPTPKGGVRAGI